MGRYLLSDSKDLWFEIGFLIQLASKGLGWSVFKFVCHGEKLLHIVGGIVTL